ncbi:hypothetical protein E1B28_011753 [Marasmius oreades]|uniref:Uncharacterized protein n=1 Tax=Marasmius oreades TaxID=181124 RepID=A0A9P7RVG6_9AGAR|nr:uncharacterized protein E1B28_011753 [Marasmius oreades]KAG7090145.1 hypothetical protein E1B28_011753 [Marasmius oreades]
MNSLRVWEDDGNIRRKKRRRGKRLEPLFSVTRRAIPDPTMVHPADSPPRILSRFNNQTVDGKLNDAPLMVLLQTCGAFKAKYGERYVVVVRTNALPS